MLRLAFLAKLTRSLLIINNGELYPHAADHLHRLHCSELYKRLSEGKQNPHAPQTVNCHPHHVGARSPWIYTQSESPLKERKKKKKASHSLYVTLASASGVSKYHTGPLIASILSYLKILLYARPADSRARKGRGRRIFSPLLITIIWTDYGHWSK